MIIRVSELPDEGLSIDESAFPASPYADRSWRLERLQLQLDRDGDEVDVRGQIRASVPQECARCAEPVTSEVVADVDMRFAPKPERVDDAELGRDDLDTDFYTDDQLDLGAIVANETTVALPMKPLCSAGCRGLCPVCGVNRNLTPCACAERAPDPRLAVLKTLAGRTQK
jgi:DUF177 domain-containing protein